MPNSFVMPDHDLSVTGTLSEGFAARAQHVYRVPGNQAPFWSHPAAFAALMEGIAATVREQA